MTIGLLKEAKNGKKRVFYPLTEWIDAGASHVMEGKTTYLNDDNKNGCIVKLQLAVEKIGGSRTVDLSPPACGETEYKIVAGEGKNRLKAEKVQ